MPEVTTIVVVDKQRRPVLSACALEGPEQTLAQLGATAKRFGLGKQCVDAGVTVELACRGCGCTEDNACITAEGPCAWVEEDLCSACAKRMVLRP